MARPAGLVQIAQFTDGRLMQERAMDDSFLHQVEEALETLRVFLGSNTTSVTGR